MQHNHNLLQLEKIEQKHCMMSVFSSLSLLSKRRSAGSTSRAELQDRLLDHPPAFTPFLHCFSATVLASRKISGEGEFERRKAPLTIK
jgi:hypothetical protein